MPKTTLSLAHDADLTGWRAHVRILIEKDVAPEDVIWAVDAPPDLFSPTASRTLPAAKATFRLSRQFVPDIEAAFLSQDPVRFQHLHALAHHIATSNGAPDATIMAPVSDLASQARAAAMAERATLDPAPGAAPLNLTLKAETPLPACSHAAFLSARHTGPWSLTTKTGTILWNGHHYRYGPGISNTSLENRCTATPENAYWQSLPRILLTPGEHTPAQTDTLAALRTLATDCHLCPLWEPANRTVFGEGAPDASIMFVGEQPGDQEDLAGRPFIGPAGQVFDRALQTAGIDRRQTYVTNAVKHFKFEPRGTRRIHQKPGTGEISACKPWVNAERRLIQPRVLVMLGATAAQSILGRTVTISRERSRPIDLGNGCTGLVTVHPSYLLRLPDENAKQNETRRFEEDLRMAAQILAN